MEIRVADRMHNVKGSVIRQFAEAALNPGRISFANGNPSSDIYPVNEMRRFYCEALEGNAAELLQYGAVQGYRPLIDTLKERLVKRFGFDFEQNELFIVSGGTQGGDIASKILLNAGDAVITEDPSYASFFNIFRSYQAELIGIPIKENGIDLAATEEIVRDHPNVRMIYTIPTFHNPTGFTASVENRRGLYEMAQQYDLMILEDDPYSEVRYAGESSLPIKAMDVDGRVFYLGSLSKVIAPAFRLGYMVIDKRFAPYVNVCKQITDVHSNALAQYVANAIITKCDFEEHLARCSETYRHKSDLMKTTLKKYLHPSVKVSDPQGGLFIMLFLPEGMDSVDFVWKAVDRGVVCVPGSGFMTDQDAPNNAIRLCYSTPNDDEIVRGAEILGKLSYELIK